MDIKEMDLLEKQDLREKVISRTEVLDKVGELLLLGNTEYATTKQVADFYGIDTDTVNFHYNNFKDELNGDGVKSLGGIETKEFLATEVISVTNYRGYFEADGQRFAYSKNTLFPKRAILRIGMLLRDSEVAKEVRTRLLDMIHDTEQSAPKIVQNIVAEITEERQLMLDRVEAEMNGDHDLVSVINAKLFGIKNKRISELEGEVSFIKHHALTIIGSRDVINRLVRMIAIKKYSGRFGKVYGELYTKVNYKLGINIKARNKKKNESYINTLTEEETFEVEKIVRSWAVEVGLDMEELLKIA